MSRPRRGNGFTLVEILLSATLLALMMAALFSAHHTAHRALRAGRERFELMRRAMMTSTRLRRILAAASPYGQRNPKAEFAGEARRLVLVSTARDPDLALAPVNVILASDGGKVLLKRSALAPLAKTWSEKDFDVLELAGVTELELAYGDGKDWVDTWKQGTRGELPAAIRLRFTLEGEEGGESLLLEEVVRIEGARRSTQR